MITNISLDPKIFNKVYLPHLLDYSHRYNVYYGGRNSGKSYFISDKLLIKGLNDKRRMLFLIKQGNKVEETIWKLFMDSIHKFQLYNKCKVNKTNHTIELPNGTYIKMTGMDDPEKAKGYVDIDTVWLEEATGFNVEDIYLLDGTLRGKKANKELYFSFNPVDKSNWVYSYFGFNTGIVPDDTFILKTTYKDNRWCTDAEIKRLERLKERNPARYKIEAEGDFATLDKLVIPYFTVESFDWHEKLIEDKGDRRFLALGSDFGFQDPTTLICSVVDDKNKKIYIFDEHHERGMLNTDIARMIISKGFRKEKIFFDCAEPKSIQELKRLGIDRATPCKKGKDSIKHGIQKILQYEIIVHPKCEHIIDEFNNYSYKKSKQTGEYTNEPNDNGFDHCIDAFRYSLQIVRQKAKILNIGL